MGTLSKKHRRGGFRRGRVNRDPLRKIVGYEDGLEVLECGHKQAPVHDIIGETNAVRRRCWRCGKAARAALPPPAATREERGA